MKRFSVTIMAAIFLLTATTVFSKEKKKSKKEIEKENQINAAVKPFQDKAAELENKIAQLEKELDKLNSENTILIEENKAMQAEAMKLASQPAAPAGPVVPGGISFKVQLGAYNSNVTAVFDEEKYLQGERVDGKNKYVIGFFTDYENAKQAVKDFKKLGIKDAWFVPYKDGQRISDKEANSYLNYDIRKK
jgi:hypothetical protein